MDVSVSNGIMQPTLCGSTFDGVPFQIAMSSDQAFDRGASAGIYKGELLASDRLVVAVKVFGMLRPLENELLFRELRAARQVAMRHPLILAFLGTADVGNQRAIVSLYMRNGNLIEYLKSHPGCDKKRLILQVAEAVNHLHSVERLVHGDLRCSNVLVSDYGEALLSDFGLSTFLEKAHGALATMTGIRQLHTARFAAPELLMGGIDPSGKPPSKTCESDVYAFGMLVLEAITEKLPWSGVLPSDMAVLMSVVSGKHPSQPTIGAFVSLSHAWWNVCLACWISEPRDRPAMQLILNVLQSTHIVNSLDTVISFGR
ncbi:kinase-like protein [Auricularia subglabra TFB-10046 SS5]|uniref:Kinase-like protein n=1 Tax=Auricularia subglabra (strain TFB-10046 / SS5) TaxID=717982 RepID=J0CYD5_AURST|nr:kinase-like protein [Auricularia subglabra TFB-10046 SS5]